MERADLEVQIIHRDQFGLTVAVSVMFKKNGDQTHKFLDDIGIRANTDLKSIEPGQSAYIDANAVDLNSLVDGAFDFIRYIGSLTTPPCTEGVYWFLLNNQLDVRNYWFCNFLDK